MCMAIEGDQLASLLRVLRCPQVALFAASASILSMALEHVFVAAARMSPVAFGCLIGVFYLLNC